MAARCAGSARTPSGAGAARSNARATAPSARGRQPRDDVLRLAAWPRTSSRARPRTRGSARAPAARVAAALEHGAQLAPAARCRSRTRCGCPRRSAAGSGRRSRRRRRRRPRWPGAAGAGSSCPGSRRGGSPRSPASAHRRLLDVVARVERADADAQLVARRERPAVARADHALVDPQLEVVAACRRDGPRARARAARPAAGRAGRRRARAASRARRRSAARARRRGRSCTDVARGAPVDLRGLELRPGAALLPQQRAQLPVVERGERPAAAASARSARGVWTSSEPKVWRIDGLAARGCAATRSARRTRTSGARRSRSGRAPARARRSRAARARPRGRRTRRRRSGRRSRRRAGCARRRAWWLGRASEG